MPIIENRTAIKKEKLKVELSSPILAQIKAYCEWAGILDIDFFIEGAASYVLTKDKGYQLYQKTLKQHNKAIDNAPA
jgi:hypothetical protein